MKNLRGLMALILGAFLLTFSACKDDDDNGGSVEKGVVKPVYGEHFSVSVIGNNVTLACTMEAATSVIWQLNNKEYTSKTQTVNLPVKGEYSVILEVSADGLTYLASEPYTFEIENSDLSFLAHGIWKALTGGPENGKVWVLDLEQKYFHAIADYYGDAEAGAIAKDAWGPWGGGYVSDYDLGGSISFDGATSTVTLAFNGETKSGTFSFAPVQRPAAADYLTYDTELQFDLWETGFVNGPYNYLPLSDSIGTVQLPDGFHFPLDSARFYNDAAAGKNTVNPSQFVAADLERCDIVHVSDSAMVVRVKRSYEGDDESKSWMLYNFIVKDYVYPEKEKEELFPTIDTSFDGADLNGTWELSPNQACGWVNWANNELFNTWETREAMMTDFLSWWTFGNPEAPTAVTRKDGANEAASMVTVTFADGTCTINNAKYVFDEEAETGEIVTENYSAGYTVSEGVFAFDAEVGINAISIALKGTSMHVIQPVNAAEEGFWIGMKNADKEESSLIQLVKVVE